MPQIKFRKPKQRIKLLASEDGGLTSGGESVRLKGNKKKKGKSGSGGEGGLRFIKLGESSYPDYDDDGSSRGRDGGSGRRRVGGSHSSLGGASASSAYSRSSQASQARGSKGSGRRLAHGRGHGPHSSAASSTSSRGGGGGRVRIPSARAPPPPVALGPAVVEDDSSSGSDSDSDSVSSSGSSVIGDYRRGGGGGDDFSSVVSGSSGSSSGSSGSSVPMDKTLSNMRARQNQTKKTQQQQRGSSTPEEEEAEKTDILARLHVLKSRGVRLSKNYTARSSLHELRMEMGRIEHEAETHRVVQRMRRWLMAGTSGLESATKSKFAPRFAKDKLSGFSGYVLDSIEDYDPIFERMGEKYGGVVGIGSTGNPIVDLAVLLLTQAFMFIFIEHKAGVKPPTADEVKKQYPDMVRNVAREMADSMRREEREQEIKMQEARENARQKWLFEQQRQHQHGVQALYTGGFPQAAAAAQQQQHQPQAQVQGQVAAAAAAPVPMAPPSVQFVVPDLEPPAPGPGSGVASPAAPAHELPLVPELDINTEDAASVFDLRAPPPDADIQDAFQMTAEVERIQQEQSSLNPHPFPAAEKLPDVPFSRSKTVEMPVSTRQGRAVKVNGVPPKSALKKDGTSAPGGGGGEPKEKKTVINL